MDPVAVLRTLWRFRLLVLPVILLTLGSGVFVYQFGPRSYESTLTYAIVRPAFPYSTEGMDPALQGLNNDNPYLRSDDPALVTNVLITRLSAPRVADSLSAEGLADEYTVARGVGGTGFIVDITAEGDSPEQSLETTSALGTLLENELYTIQTVNGADARFLFTALAVSPPDRATEQFSSRLRAVIVVFLGGGVLLLGAVSLGRGLETAAQRRRDDPGAQPGEALAPAGRDPADGKSTDGFSTADRT